MGTVSLSTELAATATLFAIAVPVHFATSRLAEMPAFTAMWAFCVASVAFAALGRNRLFDSVEEAVNFVVKK